MGLRLSATSSVVDAERTRSGLAIILLDGKRVWIPAFVYAARDLDELRKRITAS